MTMRLSDPVVGFNITVMYKGGPDGLPVIAAAPIRQRGDAGDYVDGAERTAFSNGVAGIEAWMGKLIKSSLNDSDCEYRLNWREQQLAGG